MSSLSDNYTRIIMDIEKHISNAEERKYVINKVEELSSFYLDLMDRVTKIDEERINELEKKQEDLVATISKINETLNLIKNDIYEEDGYDFEIVCPYCNHEFVADIESELKEEIECPECHNVIELDWDDEDNDCTSCGGHCSSCDHKHEEEIENDQEDNDDDM